MGGYFEPIEIAMCGDDEANFRKELMNCLRGNLRRPTLRHVTWAPKSKKVVLLTKSQARVLKTKRCSYTTFPLSIKQLNANKEYAEGFIASIIQAEKSRQAVSEDARANDHQHLLLCKHDLLFLRRNNHLARVSSVSGGQVGLVLSKPTEEEQSIANKLYTGDGLFYACKNDSVFIFTESVEDHLFKILV